VCPALDPDGRTCDLYAARPHTCRVFGPPVATEEGYGVCELCFTRATVEEVATAALAPQAAEACQALDKLASDLGVPPGETIVAFLLAHLPE
jgi:Fe-S-cluster containining protein